MPIASERQRLLDVAAAQADITTACKLLHGAEEKLRGLRSAGLPVDTVPLVKALGGSRIARDRLLIFLRNMP